MNQLTPSDLQWCLRRTPRKVLELLKTYPGLFCVAGGFIRSCIANEKVNDVDLFASSKFHASLGANYLAAKRGNDGAPSRIHTSDNAHTVFGYQTTPQIIHRWTFPHPREVIPSFDFTIASAAFWWENGCWTSACHESFYADLAAKRLVYLSPIRNEDAGGSMLRVLKFYQRGYRIPLDSLAAVIARLCQGVRNSDGWTLDDTFRHEEKLTGILSGLLREVDPSLDPSHIAYLPSMKAARNVGAVEPEGVEE